MFGKKPMIEESAVDRGREKLLSLHGGLMCSSALGDGPAKYKGSAFWFSCQHNGILHSW